MTVVCIMNIKIVCLFILLEFVNNHSVTDGNFAVPKEPNLPALNPKVLPHKNNLRQSQSYNKFPSQRNSHDPR